MEEAWNINIYNESNKEWINVLDKIIMEWFKKQYPCFMCIGRKHHPFGNERNTIFCGLNYIMCRLPILEGKYHPQQLG